MKRMIHIKKIQLDRLVSDRELKWSTCDAAAAPPTD